MDAEKVASCIQLIRGLGFQALISATNDKIQNYLETVDKIFVFANPNKKAISVQEFEKKEFEVKETEHRLEIDETSSCEKCGDRPGKAEDLCSNCCHHGGRNFAGGKEYD